MKNLFEEHLKARLLQVYKILDRESLDSIVIESGFPQYYFLDDQTAPFKPNPNFLFFCPDFGAGHILKIQKGKKPKLFYFVPSDFWHETSQLTGAFWESFFDIQVFDDYENIWSDVVSPNNKEAILSPYPDIAIEKGCLEMTDSTLSQIHWMRISKTEYEVECIRQATKVASLGHLAAKAAFLNSRSELDAFNDYLLASGQKQTDLPYGNIIAFNEKSAVLHYQKTRASGSGHTFLIDAGARFHGYCSDITRTYYLESVHPIFKTLHNELEKIQLSLCKKILPNNNYTDIQAMAHEKVTALLTQVGIITCSVDDARALELSQSFFPHGVGHALGLQVHDVGGKQKDELGQNCDRVDAQPYLRTLRTIQRNDVLTVEPGIYFIPMLLEKLKLDKNKRENINWDIVENLLPYGGIRIEDNVVARESGPENITRNYLPN